MHKPALSATVGVLVSGGLDSCILVGQLLRQRRPVQPLFVRGGLQWESAEEFWLRQYLARLASADELAPLVTLELPLADLYGHHWSTTGVNIPPADSPDEAVYLPGRNALLLIKAGLWCQLHSIGTLALAPLASNPFADTRPEFFDCFADMLHLATGAAVAIERPFGNLTKQQVMLLGSELPLECTFSCLDPQGMLHCGTCNKCAERQAAFRSIALDDPTNYATAPSACTPIAGG